MQKKNTNSIKRISVFSIIFLLSLSNSYAKWEPKKMSKKAWVDVVQRLLHDPLYGDVYQKDLLGKINACLTVPYVNALQSSKSNFHFQWYVDIDKQKVNDSHTIDSLSKLDAMVAADLLKRSDVVVKKEGKIIQAFRYTLSQKGWERTSQVRAPFCFKFADFQFEDVLGSMQRAQSSIAGFETYGLNLKFKAIVKKDAQKWSKEPALQRAFPEMVRTLHDGQKVNTTMIRGNNDWIDYTAAMRSGLWMDNSAKNIRQYYDTKPTEAEVKERIIERYVHKVGSTPAQYHYINLPGTSQFPVDKSDNTLQGSHPHAKKSNDEHYRVYIFDNANRNRWDDNKIKEHTQPWLDELVKVGIFSKSNYHDQQSGDKGSVYELNKSYLPYLNKDYLGFDIGNPKIIFDDIIIGEPRLGQVLCKFRLTFPNPPEWYSEEKFGTDTQIGQMVRSGLACYSEDDFHGSGGGGCSWKLPGGF